ncbi:MAG: serine protease [Bdellovibrionota bacterium]
MRSILALLLLNFSVSAWAITPLHFNEAKPAEAFSVLKPLPFGPNFLRFTTSSTDTYRIGDEWGKIPYSAKDAADPEISKMAKATARVDGGTGFYIGYFGGKFVMATNHHVCPSEIDCMGVNVRFTALNKSFAIREFYGSWPEVDLALFAIEVPVMADQALLNSVASPFNFASPLYRGQELATIGYGVGGNPARQLVVNQDTDCIVFSDKNEFRLMADPDDLNPGPYKAWSFANGCDVSHGDSGSAMIDRNTGEVVGIIWTGRIPKSEKVQHSDYLNNLLQTPTEDVWKELSYAVPAFKIGEYLGELLTSGTLEPSTAAVLEDILN